MARQRHGSNRAGAASISLTCRPRLARDRSRGSRAHQTPPRRAAADCSRGVRTRGRGAGERAPARRIGHVRTPTGAPRGIDRGAVSRAAALHCDPLACSARRRGQRGPWWLGSSKETVPVAPPLLRVVPQSTVRLTRRLTFVLPMLGAFTLVAVSLAAGAPPPAPPPAPGDSYSPFGVGKTAYDLVLDKLQERHEAIVALGNSSAGWRQRQQEVRASLRQLFAPLPPPNRTRTPGFVDGGNSTGDGFVLRKLLIETRPGYYASAGLFLPEPPLDRSIPAVLFPSGHSDLAWREPAAQIVAINLVKRGIAVLGYDPIGQGERRMFPDLDGPGGSVLNGTESFGCSMEHEYVQRVSTLNGVNAASSWVWDMTVLVDFLETTPGIDPHRLGVAGCSGGGVQAAYLGALDDRLVAASIACYTSTLTVDYAPSAGLPFIGGGGPAEGEQQWGPVVGVGTKLDKPDLLTIRAPRPTQVGQPLTG